MPLSQLLHQLLCKVDSFDEDIRPPMLTDFSLNLDARVLFLSFSETVNASTLNVTGLTLSDQELALAMIEYMLVSSFG